MDAQPRHARLKAEAEGFYKKIGAVFCPYFGQPVVFNSAGFHHIQFSAGRERSKDEQALKFSLLRAVPSIVKNSGTVQEYRRTLEVVGHRRAKSGGREMREVEYWGLVAITRGENPIRIKVILRRVGDGNIAFWSVMPNQKLGGEARVRLASQGIREE